MKIKRKLFLFNYLVVVLAVFMLLFACLFLIKENNISGCIFLLAAFVFITLYSVVIADKKACEISIVRRCMFINLNTTKISLKPGKGKIVMIHSEYSAFGINKKPNTFYNYDVFYELNKTDKTPVYISTNDANANKVAVFISEQLNLPLKYEMIQRTESI